jgi:hypothetical protein
MTEMAERFHVVPHPENEALLNSGLPYDLEIVQRKPLHFRAIDGVGTEATDLVTLKDGSKYVVRDTVPDDVKYPITVDFSPPLGTHVNGLNTVIARGLAANGVRSRIFGTNQAHGFSLLHDAQAVMHISHEEEANGSNILFSKDESLLIGYSMGFMKALGMLTLAERMGHEVKATIGLDAALAERLSYLEMLKDAPGMLSYLGKEIVELPHMVQYQMHKHGSLSSGIQQIALMKDTFWPSLTHMRNLLDKWQIIATGEAGTFLSDIPDEAVIVFHAFTDSKLNTYKTYKNGLQHVTYLRFIEEAGLHVDGAAPDAIDTLVTKVALAAKLVTDNASKLEMADRLNTELLS